MRILILGAGSIGRRHAANLRAIGGVDVWIYDPDVRLARELKAMGLGTVAGEDQQSSIPCFFDAVIVCCPPQYHIDEAVRALVQQAPVFIEKPISDSLDGVDELNDFAQANNLPVMVGYHMRFHKGLLNARHHWDEIGFPVRIDATYSQALPTWRLGTDYRQNYLMSLEGGIILEQSHEIDYCRWLAGEVEAVSCRAGNTGRYGMVSYDWAGIILYHKSGTQSYINLDCLGKGYTRQCQIEGTEGSISWAYNGYLAINTKEHCIARSADGLEMGDRAYKDEMRHFLACCRGEASPVVDGAEGARVLEIALSCVESAKRKGERVEV